MSAAGSGPSQEGQDSFDWRPELSVGVPEIDRDHQILFALAAQMIESGEGFEASAVVGSVLNALLDYTDYHFAREERMLEAVDYPNAVAHKARHDDMRRRVLDFQERFTADPQSVDVTGLAEFLRDWLVVHIMREDKAYQPYVANDPRAGAAAASIGVEFFMEGDGAEGAPSTRSNDES